MRRLPPPLLPNTLLAMTVFVSGCLSDGWQDAQKLGRTPASLERVVTDCAAGSVMDFQSVFLDEVPLSTATGLGVNRLLETAQPAKIHVFRSASPSAFKFDVLVGPDPGTTGPAYAQVEINKDGAPLVAVLGSFGFYWGQRPMGRSNLVRAGAIGTTFVIWTQSSPDVQDTVACLDGKVVVDCDPDGSTMVAELLANEFVTIKGVSDAHGNLIGCSIVTGPTPIVSPSPEDTFLTQVKDCAAAAGWAP